MSRLLTWVLRLLPVLGVLLFLVGAGALGNLPDSWWDTKGFIVNLVSGFTAACVGVPVAFFVLQKLLDERDDAREKLKIEQGVLDAVRDLDFKLRFLCTFGVRSDDSRSRIETLMVEAKSKTRDLRAIRKYNRNGAYDAREAAVFNEVEAACRELHDCLAQLDPKAYEESAYEVKMLLDFVQEDGNANLIRVGRALLPRRCLEKVGEYLDWYEQLAKQPPGGIVLFTWADAYRKQWNKYCEKAGDGSIELHLDPVSMNERLDLLYKATAELPSNDSHFCRIAGVMLALRFLQVHLGDSRPHTSNAHFRLEKANY